MSLPAANKFLRAPLSLSFFDFFDFAVKYSSFGLETATPRLILASKK
jgi:hypothetical protein